MNEIDRPEKLSDDDLNKNLECLALEREFRRTLQEAYKALPNAIKYPTGKKWPPLSLSYNPLYKYNVEAQDLSAMSVRDFFEMMIYNGVSITLERESEL